MATANPFGTVTTLADRVQLVRGFTREQCLAVSRMGGLPQGIIMAIESRLRRLAGTTGTTPAGLSTHPETVRCRRRNQLRRARYAAHAPQP